MLGKEGERAEDRAQEQQMGSHGPQPSTARISSFLFGRSVPVSRPCCMSLINSSALAARAAAITLSSLQFFSP